jgi:hypothetical protein
MIGRGRPRQVMEVAFGVPATFLLPFLLAGGLGTAIAAVARGEIDQATAGLIGWLLAGVLGNAALWVVVLSDRAVRCGPAGRFVLVVGLLLGMGAAARWLWVMGSGGHRYEAVTWIVWLVLLGGPLVVASFRLAQLLSSLRDGSA